MVTIEQAREQVKRLKMASLEKKKLKIKERIKELEDERNLQLRQKTSSTSEISLSDYQRKIEDLYKQLSKLQD